MTTLTTPKKKGRDPDDFYPTPERFIQAALRDLSGEGLVPKTILDPGAGSGAWGEVARKIWPLAHIMGVESRMVGAPPVYDGWRNEDFRLFDAPHQFDLVMGNPPYKYAEEFLRLCLQMLADGGSMVFLLRLAFLEGQDRGLELWSRPQFKPVQILVCSERPSFTVDGHTDATAYGLFYWRKGWRGETKLTWMK